MWMRGAALAAAVGVFAALAAQAQTAGRGEETRVKRHFKIERPAQLTPVESLTIYENIGADMAKGYAASKDPIAKTYRRWRLHNNAHYRSATHGNRYVNNYANARAANYGKLRSGEAAAVGSIYAKDSFTVASDGGVFGGALFVMEKLPAGASPATADWRYVMILPDGSLFGDSRGANADEVGFCHGCHRAVAGKQDHLFFIPKAYRRRFLGDK